MRLDIFLHQNGYTQSRNKASELLRGGFVRLNGVIVKKPNFIINEDEKNDIEISKITLFVSRAGEKLDLYLQENNLNLSGRNVLDIGSSKGGFTQVLLNYGVKSVTCVDVGSNQLDISLRNDPRVRLFENCDIKDFKSENLFDLVLCDVSFVSLRVILPYIFKLAKADALVLFKPQFEVGRGVKRNKKGVVVESAAIEISLDSMLKYAESLGFGVVSVKKSLLKGKEGNEEIFVHLKK